MARLVIDVKPASVSWPGAWWSASWSGFPLCVRPDPARDIARQFLRAGKASPDDVIVLRCDGAVVDQEEISEAARRKYSPDRLSMRLMLAAAASEVAE